MGKCRDGDQNAVIELMRYERGVTIEKCVLSKETNLYSLVTTNGGINESSALASIFQLTQKFLLTCFPESIIDATATQFAQDIVELRRDWVIDDIIMFFKFIRQRQDIPELKTYGSKMTVVRLLEFSAIYESERCDVKETFINNRKFQIQELSENEKESGGKFLADFGKHLAEKLDADRKKKRQQESDSAIKTKQWHDDNKFCLDWCKKNNLSGELMLQWYETFLLRRQ